MATTLKANIDKCKGCKYCVKYCPKGAISMTEEFNKACYQYAVVDMDKFI